MINPKYIYNKTASSYCSRSKLTKVMLPIAVAFMVFVAFAFSVATWYKLKHNDQPLAWGISWSTKYAQDLSLDPIQGLDDSLRELQPDRVRLMSYWDLHESDRGSYDFDTLDQQISIAQNYGVDVTLSIGLRQPRWPECHWPEWAHNMPIEDWRIELNRYITDVVNRYDALVAEYQLENEYFLQAFGHCPDHSRERLVDEFDMVKSLTDKPIVVSRSNNATVSWPVGAPRADIVGFSIYKRVYAPAPDFVGYFEYPFPAWFYGFLAGMTEWTTGRNSFIHELQAEPWGPGATVDLSDEEQAKTMDAVRLDKRLDFAVDTGMRTIDIWGAEWSYWRKTTRNDDSTWQVLQRNFSQE